MYSNNFKDLEIHRRNGIPICHEMTLFMKHKKFQNLTSDMGKTKIIVIVHDVLKIQYLVHKKYVQLS
jgi:hypothetical protein